MALQLPVTRRLSGKPYPTGIPGVQGTLRRHDGKIPTLRGDPGFVRQPQAGDFPI